MADWPSTCIQYMGGPRVQGLTKSPMHHAPRHVRGRPGAMPPDLVEGILSRACAKLFVLVPERPEAPQHHPLNRLLDYS